MERICAPPHRHSGPPAILLRSGSANAQLSHKAIATSLLWHLKNLPIARIRSPSSRTTLPAQIWRINTAAPLHSKISCCSLIAFQSCVAVGEFLIEAEVIASAFSGSRTASNRRICDHRRPELSQIRDRFEEVFGTNKSLKQFIHEIVGCDGGACQSCFLSLTGRRNPQRHPNPLHRRHHRHPHSKRAS